MHIESFRPVLPNTALISSADTFFGVIKESYLDFRNRGMFVDHPDEGLLVYKLQEAGATYLGVIAALPADQYRNGTIKKHEGTLAASEQLQLQLLVLRKAVVKPVLLTYPAVDEIENLLQEVISKQAPTLTISDGVDIQHELYSLAKGSAYEQRLSTAFAKTVDHTYIADGHHRTSTVDLYNKQLESKGKPPIPLLAALFSSKQVQVRAYNRAVQIPVDLSPLTLMAKLGSKFDIQPIPEAILPSQKHEIIMLLNYETFRLTWRKEVLSKEGIHLDAGLFNELVTGPIFGITDVRTDVRITYIPGNMGIRGMLDKVQHRPDRVGFLLYGLEASDMIAVVDAGQIMPPKSTWFEPRLRNGLVVLEI